MTLGSVVLASVRALLGALGLGDGGAQLPAVNVTRVRRVIARRIVRQVPDE